MWQPVSAMMRSRTATTSEALNDRHGMCASGVRVYSSKTFEEPDVPPTGGSSGPKVTAESSRELAASLLEPETGAHRLLTTDGTDLIEAERFARDDLGFLVGRDSSRACGRCPRCDPSGRFPASKVSAA